MPQCDAVLIDLERELGYILGKEWEIPVENYKLTTWDDYAYFDNDNIWAGVDHCFWR